MFYKLNEVGELMQGEITISSEGINIGWLEFDSDEEALRYFIKSNFADLQILKDTVDELVLMQFGV